MATEGSEVSGQKRDRKLDERLQVSVRAVRIRNRVDLRPTLVPGQGRAANVSNRILRGYRRAVLPMIPRL